MGVTRKWVPDTWIRTEFLKITWNFVAIEQKQGQQNCSIQSNFESS